MTRFLALVSFLLLASCNSFEVQGQEILLRYRPNEDVIDIILVYEGVGVADQSRESVERATESLRGIGRGRRQFMICGFESDLDGQVERHNANPIAPEGQDADTVRSFIQYEKNISVVDARFLLDDKNKDNLCLLQRLHLKNGMQVLKMVDGFLNGLFADASGSDAEGVDPCTAALRLARARSGGSWVRFAGNELEVSLPMSPEYAARQLKIRLGNPSNSNGCEIAHQLLASLSSIRVSDEEMSLVFKPDEEGWIRFSWSGVLRGHNHNVVDLLGHDKQVSLGKLDAEIERMKALAADRIERR